MIEFDIPADVSALRGDDDDESSMLTFSRG
jgi:hypothetical protein